jgi:hypothetical protein
MGQEQGAVSASVSTGDAAQLRADTGDAAQLRADIEETREDLGETVAALAEKTDVKTRAKEKLSGVRDSVATKRAEVTDRARETTPDGAGSALATVQAQAERNPLVTAAAAALVGGFLVGRLTKRR